MVIEAARSWVHRYRWGLRAIGALLVGPLLVGGLVKAAVAVSGGGGRMVLAPSTSWDELLFPVGFVAGGVLGGMLLLRRRDAWRLDVSEPEQPPAYRVPGRALTGLSLVLAPLLLIAGELLRIGFFFYYPDQLRAAALHPQLMAGSYALFASGLLALWPGFVGLGGLIGTRQPGWASWGTGLALTGLLVRLFHEGVNYLAFQTVDHAGLATALRVVDGSYQSWYAFYPLVFTDNAGWVVLAVGAYRSGRFGWLTAVGLTGMSIHSSGVLKGSSLSSVLLDVLLAAALVPVGVTVLRGTRVPRRAAVGAGVFALGLAVVYVYTLVNAP
jgi:hypothetical protein